MNIFKKKQQPVEKKPTAPKKVIEIATSRNPGIPPEKGGCPHGCGYDHWAGCEVCFGDWRK